jgi:penicillin amidase
MRLIKFLLALCLTAGAAYLIDRPAFFGQPTLPPLAKLFNPFTGFWQNTPDAPQGPQLKSQDLPALQESVEVVWDQRLVPHIFAENMEDAMRVQGYVTAQHRLWQMDLTARSAAGRLSEVLGERTLELDKMQRRKGLLMGAENAVAAWQEYPDSLRWLEAYTEGVNAYIQQLAPKDYPLEFKLLNYSPEPWSILKTALVWKSMAATLCLREYDVETTNALAYFGENVFEQLYPEYNPKQIPVVPTPDTLGFDPVELPPLPESSKTLLSYLPWSMPNRPSPHLGSNNWAVAGSKTASGNPILCNDPHLNLTLPSIWFEIQIHTPEINTYGVSIPGLPAVFIGFNESIAWGLTNAGHDVLDWYQIDWTDATRTTYQFDGDIYESKQVVEMIYLPDGTAVRDTVLHTHLGPIVYEDDTHRRDLAMYWLAHQKPSTFDIGTIFKVIGATSFEEYRNAIRGHYAPGQNMVFASTNGDIAITVMGKYPLKADQRGRFVGTSKEGFNWQGFIPFEHQPYQYNPSQGYVASANQHSTDPAYPYYYNAPNFDDYRGRYLNERLRELDNITVQDMMDLQTDNFSRLAADALPLFLEHLDTTQLTPLQMGLSKILLEWDYHFDAGQVAPVLFEKWWDQFYRTTWDEHYAIRDTLPILMPEAWRTIAMLETEELNVFWDHKNTTEVEGPVDIVTQSFIRSVQELRREMEQVDYNWGKHQAYRIPHLTRQTPLSSRLLQTGGSPESLNSIKGPRANGPSWRMVVELGSEVKGYGAYPGGQSGAPGSPYYTNTIDTWAAGDYYELLFLKSSSERSSEVLFTEQYQ